MSVFSRVTLRTLRENRSRTLVTIVGVILSAAMVTAVTASISSLQRYMRDCTAYTEGDWHVQWDALEQADLDALRTDPAVDGAACAQELGYAALPAEKAFSPYLYVLGGDDLFFERMPIHIAEGRLPENPGELALPEHLLRNDLEWRIGDRLTLELGERMLEGCRLTQHNPQLVEADGGETLEYRETRTYTVVGFYERPSFEDYEAPGYTAVTVWDGSRPAAYASAWFRLRDAKDAFAWAEQAPAGAVTNTQLLMTEGAARYDTYYRVLWSLGAILIGIIVFGSVSLIYNAFSISVSERTRQFGLLASVGATRPQLRRMVLTEALLVSAVGIPLGMAAGAAGIGVTFRLIGDRFYVFYGVEAVALRLHVSPAALGLAAGIALLTVLLSAWVPARRAMAVTAMEAIRQSQDVTIRGRDVRGGRLTARLFGLEGLLARKHFRRNRRRYRATVLSLFLSVVLFISASSFCAYLTDTVSGVLDSHDYDITYRAVPGEDGPAAAAERALAVLSPVEGVTRASAALEYNCSWEIPVSRLPAESRARLREDAADQPADGEAGSYYGNCCLLGVDDATYGDYLRSLGLDPETFWDPANPKAVALGQSKTFVRDTGRMEILQLLEPDAAETSVQLFNEAAYDDYLSAHPGQEEAAYEAAREVRTFAIGRVADSLPFGYNSTEYWGVYLVYPMAYLEQVLYEAVYPTLHFEARDHAAVTERLARAARDAGLDAEMLYDNRAGDESGRNMVLIVRVFAYGFIALISLIAAANVFNTISTNLRLRRREFAMLQSVGMTRRGFRRMLNYECLLYGGKALLLGLPAAAAVTYLIYRSVLSGYDVRFYLPWSAVAVAVVSVFLVVFATMLYGMRRLHRDDPIEALRNENM